MTAFGQPVPSSSVIHSDETWARVSSYESLNRCKDDIEWRLPMDFPAPGTFFPLSPKVMDGLRDLHNAWYENEIKQYWIYKHEDLKKIESQIHTEDELNKIFSWMQSMDVREFSEKPVKRRSWFYGEPLRAMQKFMALPELQLVHVIRFLALYHGYVGRENYYKEIPNKFDFHHYSEFMTSKLLMFRRSHSPGFNWDELEFALAATGLDPKKPGIEFLIEGRYNPVWFPWEPTAFINYFIRHIDLLRLVFYRKNGEYCATRESERIMCRIRIMKILDSSQYLPEDFEFSLWDAAFGGIRKERITAWTVLEKKFDVFPKLITALNDSKKEIRLPASEWLGSIGSKKAVRHLRMALIEEKVEEVQDSILRALSQIGDEKTIKEEREKLIVLALSEFNFSVNPDAGKFNINLLPAMRFRDGRPLPFKFLQWLVIQSIKRNNPVPSVRQQLIMQSMHISDAYNFSDYLLQLWIGHDTRTYYSEEESKSIASKQTSRYFSDCRKIFPGITEKQVFDMIFRGLVMVTQDSAINEKGILSLVGASISPTGILLVKNYIYYWYGIKAAQCKALIQMLAWTDDVSAQRVLVAISRRFRTAGIRKEAEIQLNALAKRKNWIPADITDRILPDGGFDNSKKIKLKLGEINLFAVLNLTPQKITVLLEDKNGNTLSSFPEDRIGISPSEKLNSQKIFSVIKKEVKSSKTLIFSHFREAMWLERSWSYNDWFKLFFAKPLIANYSRQIIWILNNCDQAPIPFTINSNNEPINFKNEKIFAKNNSIVKVFHESLSYNIDKNEIHDFIKNNKIKPFIDQWGTLPEYEPKDWEVSHWSHMEELEFDGLAFAKVFKGIGMTKGEVHGGWYDSMHLRIPNGGFEVRIDFSGNCLPETKQPVWETQLSFWKSMDIDDPVGSYALINLNEAPRPLLAFMLKTMNSLEKHLWNK